MSEIIDNKNERVSRLLKSLDQMAEGLESIVANYKPLLKGERYLTDSEVASRLKVSRRTLQDWRTNGQIAYIMLGGKTLYRESDIEAMLEKHRRKAWQ